MENLLYIFREFHIHDFYNEWVHRIFTVISVIDLNLIVDFGHFLFQNEDEMTNESRENSFLPAYGVASSP